MNFEAARPERAVGDTSPAIVVTTLGTGVPRPDPRRCSQSILIEAGGRRLLFDTGRGAATRLTQIGVAPASVEHVFFTHFHSDHTVGFADFWLTSWIPAGGGRTSPLCVTGPTGVEALVEGHKIAFADDIRIRSDDQKLPAAGVEIAHTSFARGGIVFDEDGIIVTAFESDHGDKVKPNYGYKIEYADRTVVISGDAMNDFRVAEVAADADLLFHSVGAANPDAPLRGESALILQHHSNPETVGEIISQARPKLTALIHLVLIGEPGYPAPSPERVRDMVQGAYDGRIVVADDMMRFEVGETVSVQSYDMQEERV